MKWASERQTTRIEDMAYCLLGIFDVNMPLLYGEGTKAFQRLQEEIIRITDDVTMFLWSDPGKKMRNVHCGLLAPSPWSFQNCPKMEAPATESPPTVCGRGIEFSTLLVPVDSQPNVFRALLAEVRKRQTYLAITLLRILPPRFETGRFNSDEHYTYVRVDSAQLTYVDADECRDRIIKKQILVNTLNAEPLFAFSPERTLYVKLASFPSQPVLLGDAQLIGVDLIAAPKVGKIAGLAFESLNVWLLVILGLGRLGGPWCQTLRVRSREDLEKAYSGYEVHDFSKVFAESRDLGLSCTTALSCWTRRIIYDVNITAYSP